MFDLIMKDILGTPAILVGLFALIGLLLQKKKSADIVSGTLKTIMGFLILGAGANILIASLEAFGKMFNKAFSVEGIIPNNEAIVAVAQQTFGTETAMIMLLGMIVNIIIARITKFKYIFLTGHHTMFMACLIAAILSTGGLTGSTFGFYRCTIIRYFNGFISCTASACMCVKLQGQTILPLVILVP